MNLFVNGLLSTTKLVETEQHVGRHSRRSWWTETERESRLTTSITNLNQYDPILNGAVTYETIKPKFKEHLLVFSRRSNAQHCSRRRSGKQPRSRRRSDKRHCSRWRSRFLKVHIFFWRDKTQLQHQFFQNWKDKSEFVGWLQQNFPRMTLRWNKQKQLQ